MGVEIFHKRRAVDTRIFVKDTCGMIVLEQSYVNYHLVGVIWNGSFCDNLANVT